MIIFHVIVDMFSNKKLNSRGTELFIRGRKLNISLVFITQSYFTAPKNIRRSSTDYFIVKIANQQEFQQIMYNHLSDIDFKGIINFYKKTYCKTIFIFSDWY